MILATAFYYIMPCNDTLLNIRDCEQWTLQVFRKSTRNANRLRRIGNLTRLEGIPITMLNVAARTLFSSTRSAIAASRSSLNYVSRSVVTLKEVKVRHLLMSNWVSRNKSALYFTPVHGHRYCVWTRSKWSSRIQWAQVEPCDSQGNGRTREWRES